MGTTKGPLTHPPSTHSLIPDLRPSFLHTWSPWSFILLESVLSHVRSLTFDQYFKPHLPHSTHHSSPPLTGSPGSVKPEIAFSVLFGHLPNIVSKCHTFKRRTFQVSLTSPLVSNLLPLDVHPSEMYPCQICQTRFQYHRTQHKGESEVGVSGRNVE